MSRVGKMPVKIPEKVKVSVDGYLVKIEGPKGKMSFPYNPRVSVAVDKGDPEFTLKIASIIKEMHADGTLARLSQKWYGADLTS